MTTTFTIFENNGAKNGHKSSYDEFNKNSKHKLLVDKLSSGMTSVICAKIFWILLVAAGSAILIYGLYRSKSDRWSTGTVATSSYNIVSKTEMDFPEVYICPTNYINKTYLEATKSAEDLLRLYRTSLIFQDNKKMSGKATPKKKRETDEEVESPSVDLSRSVSEMMADKFMAIGYDQNQMFLSCGFRSLFMEQLSCQNTIKSVLDPNFGKCYLATVDNDKKQKIPGQGLILVLNQKIELYPTSPALSPLLKGYVLRIGKQTNPGNFEFIYLQSGTYTKIDISEEHSVFENDHCTAESDNKMRLLKGNYTQSGCLLDCLFQTVEDKCDCIPLIDKYFLHDSIAQETTYCTMEKIQSCVLPNVTHSYETVEKYDQCRSQCLPACETWKYSARPTLVPLNEGANLIVQNGYNVSDVMYLHVAFSSLETKEFRQSSSSKNENGKLWNPKIPQNESLWVVAAIVLLVQIPVVIAVICLLAMYGRLHSKLPNP